LWTLFFAAGEYQEMRYLTDNRTTLVFDIPLAEVVTDFFDMLKSKSKVIVASGKELSAFNREGPLKLGI